MLETIGAESLSDRRRRLRCNLRAVLTNPAWMARLTSSDCSRLPDVAYDVLQVGWTLDSEFGTRLCSITLQRCLRDALACGLTWVAADELLEHDLGRLRECRSR